MTYDLRDSFLDAAYRLPKDIGKKIWKCLHRLSSSPRVPGLNLERLRGKAERLWSIRVDEKHRAILQRDENVTTLLFVGPHEDAYRFAERAPMRAQAGMGVPSMYTEAEFSVVQAPLSESGRTPASSESRTAKYVPLARYLLNAVPTSNTVSMTFPEIEERLGVNLPASARRHRPWWANDTSGGHVQATAWLSVGWKVAKVSLPGEHVIFELEGRDG